MGLWCATFWTVHSGGTTPGSEASLGQVKPTPMRPFIATPATFADVPLNEPFVCERLPGWHVACVKTTTRTADAHFPERKGTKDEWSRWYFGAADNVTRGPVVFA